MSIRPLVSIIVPSRNRGELLKPCLDGIFSQTLTDFEVLILDDGSSQESRKASEQVLKQFDDRFKLHLIHAPDTKGSGATFIRNQGIKLAQGEYLAFCDDDDFWCRDDYLQAAISALQGQGGDICFSGIEVHDPNGNIVIDKMMPNVEQGLNLSQKIDGSEGIYLISRPQILTYPDYAHLNITITRKVLAEQINGFWPHTTYAEDVGFFIRLCDQADKILFRPAICAVHNAPEQRFKESVSNRMNLRDKWLLEISVYQYLLINCQSSEALSYVRRSLANTLKMLTEELKVDGKTNAAIHYSRMAWSVYPTLKWGLYSLWLSLKR